MYALAKNRVIAQPFNKMWEHRVETGAYPRERLTLFDAPAFNSDEDDTTVGDMIVLVENNNEEAQDQFKLWTKCILQSLNKQEREVICDYFGIEKDFPMSINSIADKNHLSITRINRVINDAIMKVRKKNKSFFI